MKALLIFLLAIAAAIFYGILHDQITARLCVEYFTIAHPPILGGTTDPTLLAFGWGFIATWWVGAILGIPLALAARVGNLPPRSPTSMIRPIAILLLCMALCAAAAGSAAYAYAAHRAGFAIRSDIPPDKQALFFADFITHITSYLTGFFGGMILITWTLYARWRAEVARRLAARRNKDQ